MAYLVTCGQLLASNPTHLGASATKHPTEAEPNNRSEGLLNRPDNMRYTTWIPCALLGHVSKLSFRVHAAPVERLSIFSCPGPSRRSTCSMDSSPMTQGRQQIAAGPRAQITRHGRKNRRVLEKDDCHGQLEQERRERRRSERMRWRISGGVNIPYQTGNEARLTMLKEIGSGCRKNTELCAIPLRLSNFNVFKFSGSLSGSSGALPR